jgi:trehalose 6-phosphate phosphatase
VSHSVKNMPLPYFEYAGSRLDELVGPGMLCAFDFDGTLSPIVKDPGDAAVPAPVARRLASLADHAAIAVVSGRSVPDLRARLNFVAHYTVGNHGLEGIPGSRPDGRHESVCAAWERRLAEALAASGEAAAGVQIENKRYSLSVHYRLARNRLRMEAALPQLLAGLDPPPHIIGGKCVFNVLPVTDIDKGKAIDHLMDDCGARGAIYVGDDITDEDVFRLRRKDVLTVRVGQDAGSSADFFLPHRLNVVQLLDDLISRLRRRM